MVNCGILFLTKDMVPISLLFPTAPCVGDLIMINSKGINGIFIVKRRSFDTDGGIFLEVDYHQ